MPSSCSPLCDPFIPQFRNIYIDYNNPNGFTFNYPLNLVYDLRASVVGYTQDTFNDNLAIILLIGLLLSVLFFLVRSVKQYL